MGLFPEGAAAGPRRQPLGFDEVKDARERYDSENPGA